MTFPISPSGPSVTGESYAADAMMNGTPWEGVIAVEGMETGDGREFAANSLSWVDPMTTVIPLRRNVQESHGGEQRTVAVLVGRITRVWRDEKNPLMIRGAGVFDDEGAEGQEALRLVREGYLSGISIDPDSIKDADVEFVFRDDSDAFHGKHNQKSHGGGSARKRKAAIKDAKKRGVPINGKRPGDPGYGEVADGIEYVFVDDDYFADEPDDDDEKDDDGGDIGGIMDLFKTPTKTVFHAGRIRAATLVDIPAFAEAKIWLVDPATAEGTKTVVASGVSTRPWNAFAVESRLHNADAATVRAAYAHVDEGGNSFLAGHFLHHEIDTDGAVGPANIAACAAAARFLTSERASHMNIQERRAAYSHIVEHLREAGKTLSDIDAIPLSDQSESLVAALNTLEGPPADWFTTPEPSTFMAPTVLNEVTPNGWRRFAGHGARWGTCHVGYANTCTEPPREGDHPYFMTGEVTCADGSRVAVGSITLGTGHAPTIGISAKAAVEHYDNTGSVVALVASSDGKHGIWLAGAIPPWVSPERVAQFQAAGQVSGDWRRIGNKFRLVAFLAVNHGGFPVPRLSVGVQRGQQVSLVAAGLHDTGYVSPQTRKTMERIAASIGRDPRSRALAIRRRVKGDST